jgi:hypothetical protein
LVFLTESKRSGEKLPLAAHRASVASQLKELKKWQHNCGAESRCAEVLWLFGFATRLFPGLYKLFGYFVPVFHQFCFLFGNSPVV